MASISELTTLKAATYQAYQDCMLGKDVMFEGNRITIDDAERLLNQYLKLDRLIRRMQGYAGSARNVGIIKR